MKKNKVRFSFLQILVGLEGIAIIIACYLTLFLKSFRDYWGLSKKEVGLPLPGDWVVKEPKTQFTHAVKINAPTKYVWPWIAQIGYGRGGFYSYEALEKMIGLNIQNSDIVLPKFQQPEIGDVVPFGPKDDYPLVVCTPGQAMAIENWYDLDTKKVFDPQLSCPKNYMHLSWLWYVEALDKDSSRFISRNRVDYSASFKTNLLFGSISEPMVFTMDRKMCLGIKKRAEKLFRSSQHHT